MRLILASSSPRRFQLLSNLGFEVLVIAPEVDETPLVEEGPYDMVLRLAKLKADAIIRPSDCLDCPIVAADTIVYCDNQILGKPIDEQHAITTLNFLSGKEQQVITGYAVRQGQRERLGSVSTRIRFRTLSQQEIMNYIATGEHLDKAGAYGIQGCGAGLIKSFMGNYTNVIGLPLDEILSALDHVVTNNG